MPLPRTDDEEVRQRALRLHRAARVLDLHSHPLLPMTYLRKDLGRRHAPPAFWNPACPHQDIVRAREGGVGVWTWTVYSPAWPFRRLPHEREARRQIGIFRRFVARHADALVHARSTAEIEAATAQGKIACLLAIEGGHALGGDPANVRRFRALGCVYLTLVHFVDNGIAQGVEAPWRRHEPLPPLGRRVVRACEEERLLIDVAHMTDASFAAVVRATDAPLIATHTGVRALCPIARNLPDDAIREIARRGGVVGVISFPPYLRRRRPLAPLAAMVDHLAHVAALVGAEHAAIGTDFDGTIWTVRGLRDQAALPRLTEEMVRRGFTDAEIRGILSGNVLRLLRRAWDRPLVGPNGAAAATPVGVAAADGLPLPDSS